MLNPISSTVESSFQRARWPRRSVVLRLILNPPEEPPADYGPKPFGVAESRNTYYEN